MSLFFKHIEDKKYHIYKRRESIFKIHALFSVILFVLWVLSMGLFDNLKLGLIFILLLVSLQVLFAIDRLSFGYNNLQARSKGKAVIIKGGGILFGPSEIKIEK